eukprot:TRINITY_DN4455_c1_g1_i1.p1 TRINITY_DN4455_c1_g1~~TRINITY_DN4455_c1_g1_i1.p1  ORF type:complete len:478 (+),score=50.34 TRINITY_DN4455_c1_g1_i1:151-1584(+)
MIIAPPKARACDTFGTVPLRRSLANYVPAAQESDSNRSSVAVSASRGSDGVLYASLRLGATSKPENREECCIERDSEVACSVSVRRENDSSKSSAYAHLSAETGDGQILERKSLDESSTQGEPAKIMKESGFAQGGVNVKLAQRPRSAGCSVTRSKNKSSPLDGFRDACGIPTSSAAHQRKECVADDNRCAGADETTRKQTSGDDVTNSAAPGPPIPQELFATLQWTEGSGVEKRNVHRPASTYSCSTRSMDASSRPTSPGSLYSFIGTSHACREGVAEETPRVDILTVRQWFDEMDWKGDGYVAKQAYLAALKDNAWFRQYIVYKERRLPSSVKPTAMELSFELRKGLRFWREMDRGRKNTIDWDDFVEFFRRSGLLFEYQNSDNPRTKMAELMGNLNKHATSKTESEPMEKLRSLVKEHLSSDSMRRQSLRAGAREEPMETMPLGTVRSSLRAPRSKTSTFNNSRVFAQPGLLGD